MTRRVPPARQVHPVPQGHKAHQAPRCPEDQKDHTAHRWYKGPKAIQAHGGFKDQKEIKGHRVPKVRQDHRGSKAEKATQVLKGLRVAQVHKAPKVTRVHKSPRVIQVSRALGVIQEHKAHMALKGQRVIGAQGPPGPKGPPDPKGKSGAIKPSHTAKNSFQYLMKDVNEWSTEDGVNVMKSTTRASHCITGTKKFCSSHQSRSQISLIRSGLDCRCIAWRQTMKASSQLSSTTRTP